jgi:hypothetical protein
MKTKHYLIGALLISSISLSSCTDDGFCTKGNGDTETIILDLEDFSSIDLASSADVSITQGDVQEITVVGDANIIDLLITNVQNDQWTK